MKRNRKGAHPPGLEPPEEPGEMAGPSAPRTALDIPGLGPIRVRALQKAGLSSLVDLHGATLEQLAAVPGMSEIKARQVHTYLTQFTVGDLAAADERRTSVRSSSRREARAYAGALITDERIARARQA